MKWYDRPGLEAAIVEAMRDYPVTLIIGPRQCGKTSIARRIAAWRKADYYDLEDPETPLQPDAARTILKPKSGVVVIDEVQRQPQLFALLRTLADRRPIPARFLLLGSVSPWIVKGVSESLAGRLAFIEMSGFTVGEVKAGEKNAHSWQKLWLRGGLPASYLASSNEKSHLWRMNFIRTFIERDVPQLGIRVAAPALRRFWTMLAHMHGQVWNASELGRAMSVKEDTARHYLDILTGFFMTRQLQPWFENVGKRIVKSPKVYFRDTGLLHSLLGFTTVNQILSYSRFGFSWEGFAIEEVIRALGAEQDAFYYRTHAGAEIDLVIARGGKRYGFEFKFGDRPDVTKSMHIAMKDLKLKKVFVVYPGETRYPLHQKIEALPLDHVANLTKEILS